MAALSSAAATNDAITASLLRLAAQCEATAREAREMASQSAPLSQSATLPAAAVQAAARKHHSLHCPACGKHSGQPCDGEPTELDIAATRMMLEASDPRIRAAERERLASVTTCITPCDGDCELQPDGCHEERTPNHGGKRPHQPWACQEIRAAIGAAVEAERERCMPLTVERINELEAALRDVLRHFILRASVGGMCSRTNWIPDAMVAGWQAVLDGSSGE